MSNKCIYINVKYWLWIFDKIRIKGLFTCCIVRSTKYSFYKRQNLQKANKHVDKSIVKGKIYKI